MSDDKPRIFCYIPRKPTGWEPDVTVCALAEDGTLLAVHVSSNESWAKRDIGFDERHLHHEKYAAHYPDGYELVWVDGPIDQDPIAEAALNRNHEKYEPARRART